MNIVLSEHCEYGLPTSAGSDYHAYPFSPVQLGVKVAAGTSARLRGTAPGRYSK